MQSLMHTKREGERGFSAVEALVSVAVLAIIVLFAVTMFQSSNRIARSASIQGDSQQSARVAADLITKDMRALGYGLDQGGGQAGLVHAGPWDVIFNANINPGTDNPLAPAQPAAINLAQAPSGVPAGGALYAPAISFTTGAETIRYTLDSNGDAAVDANDQGDDAEEATPNPNDFVLRKEVYGDAGDGTNGGAGEPVAIVRGPVADQTGDLPQPLFMYWIDDDNDVTTAEVLHGDGNGDGALSQAEIAALIPVPPGQLALVTRTVITVSAEDGESQGRGDYRTRQLVSSVSFRNYIRRTAVIAGLVYQDTDSDGAYDLGDESGIAHVTVRLSSGAATITNADGYYVFEVSAGTYTITEFDPPGYVSTTSNTATLTIETGTTTAMHFGDRPGSGVGTIKGTVYHDVNQNAAFEAGEPGLQNVKVTLHTGLIDSTDSSGEFSFEVPCGTYTVVETDSTGWGSTTPNSVDVILASDGQTEVVTFGDIPAGTFGTIEGIVYLDLNGDGIYDVGELGIPDVTVRVVGQDSTVTSGTGHFSFTVAPGIHSVREDDLAGYSSSTPNLISNIIVQPDSTVSLQFGDIFQGSLDFTVVSVGATDRALSIASTDLKEDAKGDSDIILGTQQAAGITNLHVWHNKRSNSGTPITALFSPTPTFSRAVGGPVPAVRKMDFNSDGVMDLLTGADVAILPNLKVWKTITSGGLKGMYPVTADYSFQTMTPTAPLVFTDFFWPGLGKRVILVGTKITTTTGRVEVWLDTGSGSLTHYSSADLSIDANGALGMITAIATGDFNADGYTDIAVGQSSGTYAGRVTMFYAEPGGTPLWTEHDILPSTGAVVSLNAVNMAEDQYGDIDLLVGTSKSLGSGVVELWNNDNGDLGVIDEVSGNQTVSDWVDAGGEVLAMGTARLDNDVFPDIAAGTRTSLYSGKLKIYRTFGFLPSTSIELSTDGSGEVVTLGFDDFNIDGLKDIAIGTRSAISTGELVIYFGQ
jgi:type II secretory pathway pseudopilin PulG